MRSNAEGWSTQPFRAFGYEAWAPVLNVAALLEWRILDCWIYFVEITLIEYISLIWSNHLIIEEYIWIYTTQKEVHQVQNKNKVRDNENYSRG